MSAYEIKAGPSPVNNEGHASNTVVTQMTQGIDGRRVEKIRRHIDLRESSGDIGVRVVQDTSDDNVTWSGWATLANYDSFVTSEGWHYGTTFESVTQAPFVRFGLEAENTSGTTKDCSMCTLLLDIQYNL